MLYVKKIKITSQGVHLNPLNTIWRCHCRISNKTYEQIKRNQIKPISKSEVETDKPKVAARNR